MRESYFQRLEPKEKDDYEPFELEDSITLDINALLKPSVFEENDDYWILPDDDLVVEGMNSHRTRFLNLVDNQWLCDITYVPWKYPKIKL